MTHATRRRSKESHFEDLKNDIMNGSLEEIRHQQWQNIENNEKTNLNIAPRMSWVLLVKRLNEVLSQHLKDGVEKNFH
jgi:hypothetical protein